MTGEKSSFVDWGTLTLGKIGNFVWVDLPLQMGKDRHFCNSGRAS